MAKKLILFSLRLMLLNVVSIFVMMLLAMFSNDIYLWVVTVFMTFVLFYFVWRDSEAAGQKSIHGDRLVQRRMAQEEYAPSGDEGRQFRKWYGFAGGALAQSPAVVLLLIACIARSGSPVFSIVVPVARIWYFTYLSLSTFFDTVLQPDALPYVMFLFAALFSVVAGLAYLHGPAVDKKVETIIERNKAKRPRKVQDEWAAEAKRKAGQKRR
jgi:hypothetical protein